MLQKEHFWHRIQSLFHILLWATVQPIPKISYRDYSHKVKKRYSLFPMFTKITRMLYSFCYYMTYLHVKWWPCGQDQKAMEGIGTVWTEKLFDICRNPLNVYGNINLEYCVFFKGKLLLKRLICSQLYQVPPTCTSWLLARLSKLSSPFE